MRPVGGRGRPRGDGQPDQRGGDRERGGVDQQRLSGAHRGHEDAAGGVAGDLRGAEGEAGQRGRRGVPVVVVEHVADQRGPGGGERGRQQGHREHRGEQGRQRQAGDGRHRGQPGAGQVAADHHGATRVPVGQAGQQRAADQRGQQGDRVGRRRGEWRAGGGEYQQGQRDPGELVTDQRRRPGRPQPAELAVGQDRRPLPVAPSGRRLLPGGRGRRRLLGGWPADGHGRSVLPDQGAERGDEGGRCCRMDRERRRRLRTGPGPDSHPRHAPVDGRFSGLADDTDCSRSGAIGRNPAGSGIWM